VDNVLVDQNGIEMTMTLFLEVKINSVFATPEWYRDDHDTLSEGIKIPWTVTQLPTYKIISDMTIMVYKQTTMIGIQMTMTLVWKVQKI